MPIKVTCSQCGGVLHAPDDSSGKRGRCPTCGTVLTIMGEYVGPASASPQFGAPPVANPPGPSKSTSVSHQPWGSLPGGSEENLHSSPPTPISAGAAPRPTYELAKDPLPSRPSSMPLPSEPVPVSRGSRVPPDPRKYSVQDPFAKAGKPNDEQAQINTRWKKVYRGLGWVRTGLICCLLGVIAYAAIPILQELQINIPDKNPGILKIDDYTQVQEIRLFASSGFLVLGLLCVVIGRMGVAGAPVTSCARGTAIFSSLATLAALGGLIAFAIMTGLAMKDGGVIPQLTPDLKKLESVPTLSEKIALWTEGVFLPSNDSTGQIQGWGALALIGFGLLAEVWFFATLGRMAASLHQPKAAGRVNRLMILICLLTLAKLAVLIAARIYYQGWFNSKVWTQWDQLEAKWKTIGPLASIAIGSFIFAILYWRMVGGVRRAIRENTDMG